MNTTRIDTVLNRQKSNLVFDSVYAAIIVMGLLISLFGLSLTPALARSQGDEQGPARVVERDRQGSAAVHRHADGAWRRRAIGGTALRGAPDQDARHPRPATAHWAAPRRRARLARA